MDPTTKQTVSGDAPKAALYDAAHCPCLNVKCDLYQNCEPCIARHHASAKYPLTACEICARDGCAQVDPSKYRVDKG